MLTVPAFTVSTVPAQIGHQVYSVMVEAVVFLQAST